jgi:hypothetical protein
MSAQCKEQFPVRVLFGWPDVIRRYSCRLCDNKFDDTEHVRTHMRVVHFQTAVDGWRKYLQKNEVVFNNVARDPVSKQIIQQLVWEAPLPDGTSVYRACAEDQILEYAHLLEFDIQGDNPTAKFYGREPPDPEWDDDDWAYVRAEPLSPGWALENSWDALPISKIEGSTCGDTAINRIACYIYIFEAKESMENLCSDTTMLKFLIAQWLDYVC